MRLATRLDLIIYELGLTRIINKTKLEKKKRMLAIFGQKVLIPEC